MIVKATMALLVGLFAMFFGVMANLVLVIACSAVLIIYCIYMIVDVLTLKVVDDVQPEWVIKVLAVLNQECSVASVVDKVRKHLLNKDYEGFEEFVCMILDNDPGYLTKHDFDLLDWSVSMMPKNTKTITRTYVNPNMN